LWLKAQELRASEAWWSAGWFVAESIVAHVPVVGAVAGVVVTGSDITHAHEAAERARVLAGAGLMSRAEAEQLDDQIAVTYLFGGINTVLMASGIAALKVPKGNVVKVVADALAAHPHLCAAVLATLGVATSPAMRDAATHGDYVTIATELSRAVGKALLISVGTPRALGFLATAHAERKRADTGPRPPKPGPGPVAPTVRGKPPATLEALATQLKAAPGSVEVVVVDAKGGSTTRRVASIDAAEGVIVTTGNERLRVLRDTVFRARIADETHDLTFAFDRLQVKGAGRQKAYRLDVEL
jgi:hypothetical protein